MAIKHSSKQQNERRRALVASGLCGACGAKRNRFAWLCDDCATKHREKQRSGTDRGG